MRNSGRDSEEVAGGGVFLRRPPFCAQSVPEQSVSELPVSELCVWRRAVPGMRYCGRCTVVVHRFGMADKASGLAARFGTAEFSVVRTVADVHGGIDCGACLRVGRLFPVATSGWKSVSRPVIRYRDGLRPAEASVRRIMVGTDTGAEECFLSGGRFVSRRKKFVSQLFGTVAERCRLLLGQHSGLLQCMAPECSAFCSRTAPVSVDGIRTKPE